MNGVEVAVLLHCLQNDKTKSLHMLTAEATNNGLTAQNMSATTYHSAPNILFFEVVSRILVMTCLIIFTSFIFIGFIGVPLVNTIIQVLGAQFHTHHLYTVSCVHYPKSGLGPSPFILPLPSAFCHSSPPEQLPHCCPLP